jgi:hypothetical protein
MLSIRVHSHIIAPPGHGRIDARITVVRLGDEVRPNGCGRGVIEGDAFVVGTNAVVGAEGREVQPEGECWEQTGEAVGDHVCGFGRVVGGELEICKCLRCDLQKR